MEPAGLELIDLVLLRPNVAFGSDQHIVVSINPAEPRHIANCARMDTSVVGFQDLGSPEGARLRGCGDHKHQVHRNH